PGPLGNRHPSITPFSAFTAKDGHIIVGAGNDRLWTKLCQELGCAELLGDERFNSNGNRTNNVKALAEILNKIFITRTIAQWMEALEAAGLPCAPINTVDKIVNDPQVKARNMIVEVEHPIAGKLKMPGVPVKLSLTPGAVEKPAPLLGEHTAEILKEFLGWDEQKTAAFFDVKA
ncbi:MAG: CoA transferase, partial [Candidatus Accumulibacter sp.]|nr:CoA transferase [Accumulibacter sp.]